MGSIMQLDIPKGYSFSSVEPKTGKINLIEDKKTLPAKDRIKTFKDVLADQNMTLKEFEKNTTGLAKDTVAYEKLKLIVKSLNEGWTPNWKDTSEYKWYPYFDMQKKGKIGFADVACVTWFAFTTVGGRLCFKSKELALYAGKQFLKEYEGFMV